LPKGPSPLSAATSRPPTPAYPRKRKGKDSSGCCRRWPSPDWARARLWLIAKSSPGRIQAGFSTGVSLRLPKRPQHIMGQSRKCRAVNRKPERVLCRPAPKQVRRAVPNPAGNPRVSSPPVSSLDNSRHLCQSNRQKGRQPQPRLNSPQGSPAKLRPRYRLSRHLGY
jgi:hypothetical protein